MKLSRVDIKILTLLQNNGRMTKVKLAEQVHLSPSACHEHISRLERENLVSGYRADVDINRIVKTDMVTVELTLRNHRYEDFERFEKGILQVPEIIECLAVGGGFDYLLTFAVTSVSHYQELFEELLQRDLGIDKYFTYIVTKVVKPFAGYPIQQLLDRRREDRERRE